MKAKATFLIVAVLAACAFAGTAKAHADLSGKFTLPYEVRWSHTVLPAGTYTITMDRFASMAVVRSANGQTQFVPALPASGDVLKGGAFLFITANAAGEHRVRYMNSPLLGKVLIYDPISKSEREQIARGEQAPGATVAVVQN